jgi:hypothetical protein
MLAQLSPAMKFLVLIVGAAGLYKSAEYILGKRVFISFAIEDKNIRTLLSGQSRHEKTPFEFIDMSVKKPWDKAWKTQCREKIKKCHGMIVLVTKNTKNADGVHWEIKCAKEEGLPIMAMYANSDDKKHELPKELKDLRIQKWSWPNINKFIDKI